MNKNETIEFIKKKIKIDLNVCRHFGFRIGGANFLSTVVFRTRTKIGKKLNIYEHELVKQYLRNNFEYIYNTFQDKNEENIAEDAPIWILWWQGEDKAPNIVKKCINSVREYSGTHPVIVLDKHSYDNYVQINADIVEKLKKGNISITHFSDILRLNLLYQNGGIWVDATILACKDFLEEIKNYSFYTIRHGKFSDYHVCKGLWSTFLLAANKGNNIIKLFRDVLEDYLKKENIMITYLLIDCIIAVGYEDISYIRNEINKVPINNVNVFELQPRLTHKYEQNDFDKLKENNSLFKVSYKISFETECKDTYYNRIFETTVNK